MTSSFPVHSLLKYAGRVLLDLFNTWLDLSFLRLCSNSSWVRKSATDLRSAMPSSLWADNPNFDVLNLCSHAANNGNYIDISQNGKNIFQCSLFCRLFVYHPCINSDAMFFPVVAELFECFNYRFSVLSLYYKFSNHTIIHIGFNDQEEQWYCKLTHLVHGIHQNEIVVSEYFNGK